MKEIIDIAKHVTLSEKENGEIEVAIAFDESQTEDELNIIKNWLYRNLVPTED